MPKFSIKYAPEALEEIKQIVDYYNSLVEGLGLRFKKISICHKILKLNPAYNSFRYDEVRFAIGKKIPYAIHYTIDQTKNIIKIQAVLGFSQNPDINWMIRF